MMDIIINSLYTKVEIFLRELISNASDALDKIRFRALSDAAQLGSGEAANLEIRITGDKTAGTLTIADHGIGMTKQDLISYLGTVARSGTASLMEQLASGGDLNLIGQFGVGFYSVYLVSDKVRVVTKHNDDKQYIWESAADGSYTIAEDPRGNTIGRGTEITLFLKESELEYASESKLRELIKRYSEFVTFPIYLRTKTTEEVEVPVPEEEQESASPSPSPAAEGEEEVVASEEAKEASEAKPKTKKEKRDVLDWELVNDNKAIWSRKPSEIEDEEYKGFFKAMTKDDSAEPLSWIHFKGEGELEFRSILFTPSAAQSDLYENYYSNHAALRLYVRKVLISDEFEDLLPRYLNFIRGIVDSDDLPLNVSREQLQQAKILKVIQKKLIRKALEMIRRLATTEKKAWLEKNKAASSGEDSSSEEAAAGGDEEDGAIASFEIPSHLNATPTKVYTKFFDAFGKNIKLGVIEDTPNRSKLAKLLRWRSSKSLVTEKAGTSGPYRSLEEYVADMVDGQKQIYFIAGESLEAIQSSPFLEKLTARGLEVLFMTDPIDEYVVQNLPEFDSKRLQSITKEGLQLPDDGGKSKRLEEAYKESFKPLTSYLKGVYGDKVEKVTVSNRLATTPCVLVTSQFGYSANMERIMKSQAFADPTRAAVLGSRKIMEVNPRSPIVAELKSRVLANATEDSSVEDIARLLYDTALLNSGFSLDDNKEFSARVFRLMKAGLSLESLDLLPELELPAPAAASSDSDSGAAAAAAAAAAEEEGEEEL